jgi:hypothetical protein
LRHEDDVVRIDGVRERVEITARYRVLMPREVVVEAHRAVRRSPTGSFVHVRCSHSGPGDEMQHPP